MTTSHCNVKRLDGPARLKVYRRNPEEQEGEMQEKHLQPLTVAAEEPLQPSSVFTCRLGSVPLCSKGAKAV